MRKAFFVVVILFVFFVLPLSAFSQTEVIYPELPGTGITPQGVVEEGMSQVEALPLFMDYVFRLLLIVSLLSVVAVLSYAGVLYMLSSGNPERTKIAREWILSAMQGALIIFASYALLFAIDSRFVLFELRDVEDVEKIDPVDLEWEIKNRYYQIPFGLLIEDAILNEEAEKKFYDVYDATLAAEEVAERIYEESVILMEVVEREAARCPAGVECGAEAEPEEEDPEEEDPEEEDPEEEDPEEEDEGEEDPDEEDPEEEDPDEESGLGPATYIDEDGNEWVYDPESGDVYLYDPENDSLEATDPPEGHPFYQEESSIKKNIRSVGKEKLFIQILGMVKGQKESSLQNDDIFGHFYSRPYFLFDIFKIEEALSWDGRPGAGPEGWGSGRPGWEVARDYIMDWLTDSEPSEGLDYTEGHEIHEREIDDAGEEHDDFLSAPSDLVEEYEEEEETDENGEEEDNGEEDEDEEEIVVCITCPDIRSPILAQIAVVQSYMAQLPPRLDALEDTKDPLLQDLYELYKVAMLKSLGSREVFGYNSFLLERRYYEREEIVIETNTERVEIGPYVWDWSQWIENILYEVEVGGNTIEENDPATFYFKRPDNDEIIEDALALAREAWEAGIQDAGDRIGIERGLPSPPPDIGTTLYPPVSPNPIRITSPYGERYDPFTGEWRMHPGIDFGGPRNTPIYASEDGEVVFADWAGSMNTGYGKLVAVYHRAEDTDDLNQDIVTYYAHLDQGSIRVKEGDNIKRGDHIAGMGTTGRSTGYHLHYEVRTEVSYPFELHTGEQVDPAPYIDTDRWGKKREQRLAVFLQSILEKLYIGDASALTDMDVLNRYLEENNLRPEDLTLQELTEIMEELGIEPGEVDPHFDPRDVEVKSPSDYLTCGMEIPVGETFELTWEHLVEILDTIDNYIAEGRRLLEQQRRMNSLASTCECPCAGPPTEDCPGRCQLNCPVGAIRAAHEDVARTRQAMRELAEYLILLTDGHFNTPTEDVCDPLNEDIRNEEEKSICDGGGSKLITKHELITRKLNYSRFEFDECMTRPEHLEETLEGGRPGKMLFFGPLVEEEDLPRYTKTKRGDAVVNTSDLNWFCCSDSRIEDN